MNNIKTFNDVIKNMDYQICNILSRLPNEIKQQAKEIRINCGQPISIFNGEKIVFVDIDGNTHLKYYEGLYKVTKQNIQNTFKILCGYSVHSFQNEIINGYITIKGGHRAGIAGTAVVEHNHIIGLREINAINLRIANQIDGISEPIISYLKDNNYPLGGILIIGTPASGKTTLLKDLCLKLSDGELDDYLKLAVVDERGEVGSVFNGQSQNNIGCNTIVLDSYPKGEGINIATRTLSPDIIVCDEIGSKYDADSILNNANCGVDLIATTHCKSLEDIQNKKNIKNLLKNNIFEYIVVLSDKNIGEIKGIYKVGEVYDKIFGLNINSGNK